MTGFQPRLESLEQRETPNGSFIDPYPIDPLIPPPPPGPIQPAPQPTNPPEPTLPPTSPIPG